MANRRRGSGWVFPALTLILFGAVAAYFFVSGEDGARALSLTQIVVGLADIVAAFVIASRRHADLTYYGYPRRSPGRALWAGAAVMALVAGGLWWTTTKAGIEAAPLTAGPLTSGQSATWQPSPTGVRRDRLQFTPMLNNADSAGLCAPSAKLTAELISAGSIRDVATAASGQQINLDLGPHGDARQVKLTVTADQACRITVQITGPEFVS